MLLLSSMYIYREIWTNYCSSINNYLSIIGLLLYMVLYLYILLSRSGPSYKYYIILYVIGLHIVHLLCEYSYYYFIIIIIPISFDRRETRRARWRACRLKKKKRGGGKKESADQPHFFFACGLLTHLTSIRPKRCPAPSDDDKLTHAYEYIYKTSSILYLL